MSAALDFPERTADVRRMEDEQEHAEYVECVLRPRVRDELTAKIKRDLAKPGSDIYACTADAWNMDLILNQLEQLARVHAAGAKYEDLGRAFGVICDQCIGVAVREGLDEAVKAELRRIG